MSKFDAKIFRGAQQINIKVNGSHGVSKLYIWNKEKNIYEVPLNKKAYRARKTILVNGKKSRPSEYFNSLDECKIWLQSMDKKSNFQNQTQFNQSTFQEILAGWKIANYSQLADGTKIRYDRIISTTFPFFNNVQMANFNKALINKWIEHLKASMFTVRRIRFKHELKLLHSILKYYADSTDNFIMPITPFHRKAVEVQAKKTKNQDLTEPDFLLFKAELEKLKDGNTLARMCVVQYYHALRISEVAALSKSDVSLDMLNPSNSKMIISRSLKYLRLKGTEPKLENNFKNSKSSGVKELPVFPETFEVLRESSVLSGTDFLFLDSNNKFFSYRTLQQRYNSAFKKAGLPFVGTHVLRHGGTRHLYNQYPDLALAGQLLGNSDISTISVYAKRDKRALFNVSKELWEKSSG